MTEAEQPGAPRSLPPAQPVASTRRQLPTSTLAWAITAINVAVFIMVELSGGSTRRATLILFGANYAPAIAMGEYWRLLTACFLHIGLPHLLFNTFALLSFGRLAEAVYGHSRFLAIYLVSGVVGSLLSYLFNRGLSAGASGAIFGVATALAIFHFRNHGAFKLLGGSGLGGIVFVLIANAAFGLSQPGIDNWGHAGGALGGAILAMWLTPRAVLMRDGEGEVVGVRWQPSPPTTWAIVPVVLAIIAITLRLR